ncbi:hypothetical protein BDP81DRAFT_87073 [Colletotrichum phormii]|uniref:Uncharacterized protein n=1 Tax=Colletotrichum phormii TaxID=359342 RepID=A0AAJ0A1E2_9PEZI|nr:uncharacterized protein BDP81DRAFT_87073 [Colletotrichum phormii]KAK1654687.1 hypothetical protein BDP81DRAFT_87073 [Colletotrichum phormii]
MKMYPCPTTLPLRVSLFLSTLLLVSFPSYLLSPVCVFSSLNYPIHPSPVFVLIGRRKTHACPDIFVYARNAAHMTRKKKKKEPPYASQPPPLICCLCLLATNVSPPLSWGSRLPGHNGPTRPVFVPNREC